jgi:hypothetical protein
MSQFYNNGNKRKYKEGMKVYIASEEPMKGFISRIVWEKNFKLSDEIMDNTDIRPYWDEDRKAYKASQIRIDHAYCLIADIAIPSPNVIVEILMANNDNIPFLCIAPDMGDIPLLLEFLAKTNYLDHDRYMVDKVKHGIRVYSGEQDIRRHINSFLKRTWDSFSDRE